MSDLSATQCGCGKNGMFGFGEAAAALASSSFFFSSPAAEMVLEMTVAVAAEVMAVTASGLS